ncbi:MAG: hypothetical protein RL134_385 [Actinomycetota bacterium]
MRRFAVSLAVMVTAASLLAPTAVSADSASRPGHAALPGPVESYLYVVDAEQIRIVPGNGSMAKVVVSGPSATRFSDRPYRHARQVSVREVLSAFGWSAKTYRLAESTPNAAISLGGRASQVVDIKKAKLRDGTLVLTVSGIHGRVKQATGAGSIFIDNASPSPTYPQSQTQNVPIGPGCTTPVTAVATLTSATSVDVSVLTAGSTAIAVTLTQDEPQTTVTAGSTTCIQEFVLTFAAIFDGPVDYVVMYGTVINVDTGEGPPPLPTTVVTSWYFGI